MKEWHEFFIYSLVYDLVICGMKSTDGDTAQVGPGIAEFLDIPHVSWVSSILELGEKMGVKQMLEDCYRRVQVELPCLITVTKEINDPRLPSFKDKLQAKRADIEILGLEDLGLNPKECGLSGSPTRVIKTANPSYRKKVEYVDEKGFVEKLSEWRII
jgi:electron transfer flavoprotein beta subunit